METFLHNHPECVITDAARPDLDVTEALAFADDQTTLTGLPLGVVLTVTVTVTAHNEWGDGADGAAVTITLA